MVQCGKKPTLPSPPTGGEGRQSPNPSREDLTLNPSIEGEGLKVLTIRVLLPLLFQVLIGILVAQRPEPFALSLLKTSLPSFR
jgi:hypothetical protein